jgi:hypothetical protein
VRRSTSSPSSNDRLTSGLANALFLNSAYLFLLLFIKLTPSFHANKGYIFKDTTARIEADQENEKTSWVEGLPGLYKHGENFGRAGRGRSKVRTITRANFCFSMIAEYEIILKRNAWRIYPGFTSQLRPPNVLYSWKAERKHADLRRPKNSTGGGRKKMKRLLAVCSLVGILAGANWVGSAAQAQANFSGTWVLDKEKTSNLPPQLESYTMIVTQSDRELSVETKIVGDFRPPGGPGGPPGAGARPGEGFPGAGARPGGGPPGGGPGGLGGPLGMAMPNATYRLDGKETTLETTERMPGTVALKAKWKNAGQALELTTTRYLTTPQGDDLTLTTKEQWGLAEDGKVLKIRRTMETPMGARQSELIFNRQ